MDSIKKYIRGYVRIRLESPAPDRFFSLCVHNRIPLRNLTQEASFYEMELSARDFLRLGRFRRKTDARIHILSKNGLPFFLLHARKRKAFFLGIFLGFFLLFVCSLRIWDIQITGNRYYTTPVLLDTLSEWDIHCGMAKKNVDCQKLMQKIRQTFPGVVWVSAKLEGTCLIIDIRENDEIPQSTDALADTLTSWDLTAPWNGTVVSIITRMGMPQVKPGDVCKKGDILVSGSVAILDNDSQIQRYEYVRADADIVIKTQFPYYDEFSRTVTVKSYPGEQESYPFLHYSEPISPGIMPQKIILKFIASNAD